MLYKLQKNNKYWFHFTLLDDENVSCENGQALSIFGEFCYECPLIKISSLALTSNCSKMSNHFCPMDYTSSKICMDKVNVPITDYCSTSADDKPWICPKANKGLNFEQCYEM